MPKVNKTPIVLMQSGSFVVIALLEALDQCVDGACQQEDQDYYE